MRLSNTSIELISKYRRYLEEDNLQGFFDALGGEENTGELFKYMMENIPDFLSYFIKIPAGCVSSISNPNIHYDSLGFAEEIIECTPYAFAYAQIFSLDLSQTGIIELPTYCFSWAKIGTLLLPKHLEVIKSYCFTESKILSSIHIPFSVKNISDHAFMDGKYEIFSTDKNIIQMLEKCKEVNPEIIIKTK